jgi:hypothetical protein
MCDRGASQGSPQSREHAVSRSSSLRSARACARAVPCVVCPCVRVHVHERLSVIARPCQREYCACHMAALVRTSSSSSCRRCRTHPRVRTQAAKHTREDAHRHGASQRATARGGHGWAGSVIGTHARAHTGSRGTSAAHAAPADGSTASSPSGAAGLVRRRSSAARS